MEELKQVIAEAFEIEPDSVSEGLEFDSITEWDSLGHVRLMLALEEKYGIEVDEELMRKMISFKAIVSMLKGHPEK